MTLLFQHTKQIELVFYAIFIARSKNKIMKICGILIHKDIGSSVKRNGFYSSR